MRAVADGLPTFFGVGDIVVCAGEDCETISGCCYKCSAGAVAECASIVGIVMENVIGGLT